MALLKKKSEKSEKAEKAEKTEYVICERCELNYVPKKQKYCDVCKAELSRDGASMLLPDEDEELERLCPVCKVNYMNPDEEMCFMCVKERADKDDSEPDWDDYEKDAEADDLIEDEPLDIPLDELAEEEEALEEEEEFGGEPDDFEYVDPDDEEFDDLDDEDEDEDEDDF